MDALLDLSDPTNPREAEWPAAEFIVGNPPFLGGSLLRSGLGADYTETLWSVFDDRASANVRPMLLLAREGAGPDRGEGDEASGPARDPGHSGQQDRRVLERINETGGIFFARSDDPWVLSGANVHISFVGQDDGGEAPAELDGTTVAGINANLTVGLDLTLARRLQENLGIAFEGDKKGGPFEIDDAMAKILLAVPNPDDRSNTAVRPWVNGQDLYGRRARRWIVDFGVDMPEHQAALYEAPFQHILGAVRQTTMRPANWWRHGRPRPEMRAAVAGRQRTIATVRHSKHRIWTWLDAAVLPDSALVVVAEDDDYTFGVLHSRVHEVWARATGTQLREVESGFRHTPTRFETFPFPRPTDESREAITAAARELARLRDGWLNPPGLDPAELGRRTLTNLYNARPTWLGHAHAALDTAVLAAYGWPPDLTAEPLLAALLALNLAREPA